VNSYLSYLLLSVAALGEWYRNHGFRNESCADSALVRVNVFPLLFHSPLRKERERKCIFVSFRMFALVDRDTKENQKIRIFGLNGVFGQVGCCFRFRILSMVKV